MQQTVRRIVISFALPPGTVQLLKHYVQELLWNSRMR